MANASGPPAFYTQLLTGKDNATHDIARWLGTLAIFVGIALEIYSVIWLKKPFNLQEYGLGMGAVFTGLGAAIKLKENTEP